MNYVFLSNEKLQYQNILKNDFALLSQSPFFHLVQLQSSLVKLIIFFEILINLGLHSLFQVLCIISQFYFWIYMYPVSLSCMLFSKMTKKIISGYGLSFFPYLLPSRIPILEEGMATHSSILAWRIPWTEETAGLQSKGSDMTEVTYHACMHRISILQLKF